MLLFFFAGRWLLVSGYTMKSRVLFTNSSWILPIMLRATAILDTVMLGTTEEGVVDYQTPRRLGINPTVPSNRIEHRTAHIRKRI